VPRFRFARSTDYSLIRPILTDPKCYRRMVHDGARPRELATVGPVRGADWIVAFDGAGAAAAVFLLAEIWAGSGVAEVHICCAPRVWGSTVALVREFLAWAWGATRYEEIRGPVPSYNRLVLRLALRAGFERCATVPDAGTKNGELYDLLVMRAKRPKC
jgi:RimJ/RimL family protein N-acetyltransferase